MFLLQHPFGRIIKSGIMRNINLLMTTTVDTNATGRITTGQDHLIDASTETNAHMTIIIFKLLTH